MKPILLLIVVVGCLLSQSQLRGGGDRPNILYLYVDDMGWGAIGPNGQASRKAMGQPYLLTPNLDRLASEGVNFTRSYGCTVCSPARSSQQSGFHQGHTFADRNDPDNAKKAMRADDVLMGDVLSKAGYATGYWGKWGYGGSRDLKNPVILNTQTLPTSHGYQHVVTELHHVRAHTFFQPTLWRAPAQDGALGGLELVPNSMAQYLGDASYPNVPALQNHPNYPSTAYCDDVYAFAALDFVKTQALRYVKTGEPFFGLLAVQVPHAPFAEISQLPEWDKAYNNVPHFSDLSDQAQQWAAMVTRIDGHIGNLLSALDDPNGDGDRTDSVAANTLVIFQSDNGGPQHNARKEFAANGGLRGRKGQIYEGGIRVPTIVGWPAKITSRSVLKRGTSHDRVIDVSDFLPTFCELAGASIPVGLDGVSLAPMLTGEGRKRVRDFLIHEAGRMQSIIYGRYKLIRSGGDLALYDLQVDPAESNDISASQSDLVEKLEALLLGERVAEPRGFANTYHRWIGMDKGDASDPGNWSDYIYSNAGGTYQEDRGSPRSSWIATVENSGSEPMTLSVGSDLEFLGLDLRGGSQSELSQTLILGGNVGLVGRNEIRISKNGRLVIKGGKVTSLRWVEILREGAIEGAGTIDADLFNSGSVRLRLDFGESERLNVRDNYYESEGCLLEIEVNGTTGSAVDVEGQAHLAGELKISIAESFVAVRGKALTVLTADRLVGRFSNSNDLISAQNGVRFRISYADTKVIATVL
jgi:arylsulfatase A-like enzyme